MPSPHAGFAAVTVVSEALVNECLSVYVNNFLAGLNASIQSTVPMVVGGTPTTISVSGSAVLLSVRARLLPNAAGLIHLTFRFFASPGVAATPLNGATAARTFRPEIALDVQMDTALIASVQADQFQFGVDVPKSHLGTITAMVLDPDGMPPAYQSQIIQILQGPQVRGVVQTTLNSIPPEQLSTTPGTVPAFYDFTMKKPLQPDETWVSARVATSRLVYFPLNGVLALACDVPGFTNGVPQDLRNFLPPGKDIATVTNLDFLQGYFAQSVLPQMRNTFVKNNFRIDSIGSLEFLHKDFVNGPADYMQMAIRCSFWTHDFLHFIIQGTTKISNIGVTIPAVPYIYRGEVHAQFGMIEGDLPDWLDILILGASLILPPITLFLPAIIESELHNALVDVANKLNGGAAPQGMQLQQDFNLPKTAGPMFRFDPSDLFFRCGRNDRFVQVSATLRVIEQPSLIVALADQNVKVNTGIDRQEVRREGGLSESITARLLLPAGIVQRKDPTLRVRFDTALNGKAVPSFTRDMRLFGPPVSAGIGMPVISPQQLDIVTAQMVSPTKLDQEVRISCRLYRSLGGVTDDIYNGTIHVVSVDPRPDEVKPYVQWAHRTAYYNNHRKVLVVRRSKIHKAPGKGGCRFSNQFLTPRFRSPAVFVSLRRFTGLPFDIGQLEQNRDIVCPYCFFGGPDKHQFFHNKVDLTGVVGKVYKS